MSKTIEEQISGFLCNAQENIKAAYLKGYNNGLSDGNINKGTFAAKVKEAYNNGLNDAEKALKRVINEPSRDGLYANEMQEIFGTEGTFVIFLKYSVSEIIEKIREYDNKKQINNRCDTCKYQHLDREHFPCCDCCDNDRWEQGDSEIHVGDEFYYLNSKYKYVVLSFLGNGKVFAFSGRGLTGVFALNQVHKTGRNYPVKEILEKLNESEE